MTSSLFHPTMERLGLSLPNDRAKKPSARDVLSFLLRNNVLTDKDVETAYDSLTATIEEGCTSNSKASSSAPVIANKADKDNQHAMNHHRYRHVALRFYYDGANYSGLAENIGMETDQSVEKSLFAALQRTQLVVSRDSCGYSRCGRTDRGVSSAGQVVAMHLRSNLPRTATWDEEGTRPVQDNELPKNGLDVIRVWVLPKKGSGGRVEKVISEYSYDKILNNILPPTIRIIGWCPVSNDFSARFSAITRTYRYFFIHRPDLDLVMMRKALEYLKGKHDFRNFCKMDVEKVYNFERVIHDVDLVEAGNTVCFFQILGQAFLWHQIRCIVSILFMIGRGHEKPEVIAELLNVDKYPGKPSYPLAPERPLVLHDCGFHELKVGHTTLNFWSTHCELERQWEDLVLATARIRNCIQSMLQMDVVQADVIQFARTKLRERLKKQDKHNVEGNDCSGKLLETLELGLNSSGEDNTSLISWKQALDWLHTMKLFPSPESLRECAHTPLIHRHKGTTYEEKIDALSNSKRRRERYHENVVKKRKTQEVDAEFFEHMLKQGGSAR